MLCQREEFDVVVIGAGQAGLAAGYFLTRQHMRFIILDGAQRAAQSWRTRSDSLVLYTPAQFSSLPGFPFPGDPTHYPTKDEASDYLEKYVDRFGLPVRYNSMVLRLSRATEGYLIETCDGLYSARHVVVATGPNQKPSVPPLARNLAPSLFQLHSKDYRNPEQIPSGPVLVVGAGNSGARIAEELSHSREVHLSVGEGVPQVPQRILGLDFFWWIYRLGFVKWVTFDTRIGRKLSRQDPLIGIRLDYLEEKCGVRLHQRVEHAHEERITFEDGQILNITNIIWATGYQADYGWIEMPIFDDYGRPLHRRGVTDAEGLYFLGLSWQFRRDSALLNGVGRDAEFIARIIESQLCRERVNSLMQQN